MRTIEVVPYNAAWADAFARIRAELLAALGDAALAVEHVGSTSVPGLWAKPIIDIDIVIREGMFDAVAERLNGVGYAHVGDQGIPGREAFKYADKPHLMPHHLYVCREDAGNDQHEQFFRGSGESAVFSNMPPKP